MEKLTIVIPTYTITKELEEMAEFAAASYRPFVDEIIITEDGGKESEMLRKIADIYIYSSNNVGFTKNVNRGWKLSSGDFTGIVNSDTCYMSGNLRDLCVKGKVTSPTMLGQEVQEGLSGSFFVVPKEIAKERGLLMEEMVMYDSDSEYKERTEDVFQLVPQVEILHDCNKTTKATPELWEKMQEQSKKDVVMYNETIKKGGLLSDKRSDLLGAA